MAGPSVGRLAQRYSHHLGSLVSERAGRVARDIADQAARLAAYRVAVHAASQMKMGSQLARDIATQVGSQIGGQVGNQIVLYMEGQFGARAPTQVEARIMGVAHLTGM
jgi:hypothetical protein